MTDWVPLKPIKEIISEPIVVNSPYLPSRWHDVIDFFKKSEPAKTSETSKWNEVIDIFKSQKDDEISTEEPKKQSKPELMIDKSKLNEKSNKSIIPAPIAPSIKNSLD